MSAIAAAAPPSTHQHPKHWSLWYVFPVMEALPIASKTARAHVRDALREWQLPHFEDNAILVTSELVTNAMRASGYPRDTSSKSLLIQLSLFTNLQQLLIVVYDQAPGFPEQQAPSDVSETGRGLQLIDRLGTWDYHLIQGGKIVRVFLETAA